MTRPTKGTLIEGTGVSRAQTAYTWIKQLIRKGSLQPGARLREAEIAERLGVSRTPVREAINRLLSEGLIAVSPTRGFAVAELSKQEVLELYGLREFLEGAATRFAAQHASSLEIETLRDMVAESLAIGEDAARQAVLNKRFHAAIGGAAHNRYLERALARLSDSLGLVVGTTFEIPGRARAVYEEHTTILNAIESRDADRAETSAREHIRKAAQVRLRQLFGRD